MIWEAQVAAVTGEGALGMQGQELVGCREEVGFSRVPWVQCGVRNAKKACGCSSVQYKNVRREYVSHKGVQVVMG